MQEYYPPYVIAVESNKVPVGSIFMVSSTAEEFCAKYHGYLPCDGRVLRLDLFPSLYSAIGKNYNIGGEKMLEFRLPNTNNNKVQLNINTDNVGCTCDFRGANCWLGCRCGYGQK